MKNLALISFAILLISCYDHEAEKKRLEELEFHTLMLQNQNNIKAKERELYYLKKMNQADSISSHRKK